MIVIAIILICILLYIQGTKNFKYWEKKGIQYCKPTPFFGNSLRKYLRKISPTDQLAEIYRNFPGQKCVGCFESNHRSLVLRDPQLIKHVLVTDFLNFYPKGMNIHETEPLMNNLFSADGDLWKVLRQNMSVAFTTGKLKSMFPVLLDQAKSLDEVVLKCSENDQEIDVRDLMARYTTDAIAACGFGVDANSLNDETSIFRKLGKRIFNVNLRDYLVFMLKFLATDTFKYLNFFAPEVEKKIYGIVNSVKEARNGKPIGRKDFMDILLEMHNKKTIIGESLTKRDENGVPEKCEIVLNSELLTAQAFILFGAGYETSAASISFVLNQLAYNKEIQEKCQKEIDTVLEKHGKICYEAISEMKYLEMVFKEGLRMFPPIGFLIRKCAREYTFPDTNLTIDKGVVVLIPLQAMQNDEKYFEEPDKFIPERFHPDNAREMKQFSFLPFGAGPRACIGQRFGILGSLTGLATILSKYTVVPSMNSRRKLMTDPTIALVQNIKGGIPLKFVKREVTC
ncbi:cytochrome P450 6B7-like [Trichoplusia ni]|uniref:unspecific monooxygenase n=1 Tax=Trichoplusia ni TaxID=7111 RepID=A0A7E5WMM3_TRINI|nr:cytochrome P450 6B7-like [Trichoplusia ni]